MDSKSNKATSIFRTVIVKDTKCPSVKIVGLSVLNLEAGFPYIDAGATAKDAFDGKISSKKITTQGDDVDTKTAFRAYPNCAQIKASMKVAGSADYFVSAKGNKRAKVFCDMSQPKPMSYFVCNRCTSVVPYGNDQGDCAKRGLVMVDWRKTTKAAKKSALKLFTEKDEEECKYIPLDATARTNYYLCTTPPVGKNKLNHATVKHSDIAHAEDGKYIISYHVKDASGNSECKPAYRTVIVRDTLAPVIALRVGKTLIQKSDGSAVGIDGVANPANKVAGNPFLQDKVAK
jgi:hypothetical protein